jgi:hypothetical protein
MQPYGIGPEPSGAHAISGLAAKSEDERGREECELAREIGMGACSLDVIWVRTARNLGRAKHGVRCPGLPQLCFKGFVGPEGIKNAPHVPMKRRRSPTPLNAAIRHRFVKDAQGVAHHLGGRATISRRVGRIAWFGRDDD